MLLKRLLVGLPLKTKQAVHERLSKRLALAVFSSNAISSVAYATEEILLVLVLAGAAAVSWSVPISLAIVLLVVTVHFGAPEEGVYVPPRLQNGRVVPGHIEPKSPR